MKNVFKRLRIPGGGGSDAASYEEAMEVAAAANKPVLVDLYVPF